MIFFVHIGKTAGSTMNRYLKANYPRGLEHCEGVLQNAVFLAERVPTVDWMSGHVNLPTAMQVLSPLRPDIRYFTCVREPAAQVRSHYNWLVEIFRRGPEFYAPHPPQVKAISERVRQRLAQPSPAGIADDLRRFGGLFLDYQIRFFLGNHVATLREALAEGARFAEIPLVRQRVGQFDAIGDNGHVEALFNHIFGAKVYSEANQIRENTSRYYFDPGLFESDAVRETLETHNRLDRLLYDFLTERMTGGLLVNRPAPAGAPDLTPPASRRLG